MNRRPDTYVISDLTQIKALADPLRQRLLAAFVDEPRTTKQVAVELGQPPTRLYHHVDLLERAGLLELVETRPKRGTTEKYFRAIANRFAIAGGSLGGEAGASLNDTLAEAFSSAEVGIRTAQASDRADEQAARAIVGFGALLIGPEDLPKIRERILSTLHEICSDAPESSRQSYRYLVALYPSDEQESTAGESRRPEPHLED
jgi:DNA-binding transcriptional ArsR family regulator